jgi:hypothetical protein
MASDASRSRDFPSQVTCESGTKWVSKKESIEQFVCIGKTPFNFSYRGAGNPEATAPISVRRVKGSSVPLNSGRNAASVYGQRTLGEPL